MPRTLFLRRPRTLDLLVVALVLAMAAPLLAGGGPQNVLVVANRQSADSLLVANAYRAARQIPQRNVCLLDLPPQDFRAESLISRELYDQAVARPIRDFLARHPAGDQLHFIALAPDLPLRVAGGPQSKPLSLASRLTLVAADLAGPLPNPYCGQKVAFEKPAAADPKFAGLRLVTWLRGYERSDALALVERSLAADGSAPKGSFYFVPSPHTRGYEQAAELIRARGFEAQLLEKETPLTGAKDVIAYFSGGFYSKLAWANLSTNAFRPGAVVDMLQSYGAVWYNWRTFGYAMQVPAGQVIRAGATGVHASTDEPFAGAFPSSGLAAVFFENYLNGCNLAEAYWSAINVLGWQNAVFGDPLCAPYARRDKVSLTLPPPEAGSADRTVAATIISASTPKVVRFFVDDRLAETVEGKSLPVREAGVFHVSHKLAGALPGGWHRVRVVSVADGPAAVQSFSTADVETQAAGGRLQLKLQAGQENPAAGDKLTFAVEPGGRLAAPNAPAQTIELLAGDLRLGAFQGGALEADTAALGAGPHELQAVVRDAVGQVLAQSNFLAIELAEPLHVVQWLPGAAPGAATGTRPILLLRYNADLPFGPQARLPAHDAVEASGPARQVVAAAVRLTQEGRAAQVRSRVEKRYLLVEPAAPLRPGVPCTLTVAFPQTAAPGTGPIPIRGPGRGPDGRSNDFRATFTPAADDRLLYTLTDDSPYTMTVEGLTGSRTQNIYGRPAKVILGPVDVFSPLRPALWSMAAYEVSAVLTISEKAQADGANGAGLGVHYSNMNNCVYVRLERSRVVAMQVLAGNQKQLGAWLPDGKTSGETPMTLRVDGPQLTVAVGGRVLGTVMLDLKLPPGLPWIDLASPVAVSAGRVRVSRL